MADDDTEDQMYSVVLNHEEQYSIWRTGRDLPPGWREEGMTGTRSQCLEHIDKVWTDMRPLSLRNRMEELARTPPEPPSDTSAEDPPPSLVERLSQGRHSAEFCARPTPTPAALKERIDNGYVLIRFPNTRGGTELGIRLERDKSDLSQADFERASGTVLLVGTLTLDGVPVRCTAQLDLATLKGEGALQRQS